VWDAERLALVGVPDAHPIHALCCHHKVLVVGSTALLRLAQRAEFFGAGAGHLDWVDDGVVWERGRAAGAVCGQWTGAGSTGGVAC